MAKVLVSDLLTTVSAVFLPVDTFNPGAPLIGDVSFRLEGRWDEPVYHHEGYVLFLDLEPGEYRVIIESKYYMVYETFIIDPATLDPLNEVIVVNMHPNADYPFPEGTTLVRGVIREWEGDPLVGAKVQVAGGEYFALTDEQGRCTMFFKELSGNPQNTTFDVSRDGYLAEQTTLDIIQSQTVTFTLELRLLSDVGTAIVKGTVRDDYGFVVSQALIEFPEFDKTDRTDLNGNFTVSFAVFELMTDAVVRITQDGYGTQETIISLLKGGVSQESFVLETELLPWTASLKITVNEYKHHHDPIPEAVVTVPAKSRTVMTDAGGCALLHFNLTGSHHEDVDIEVRKDGYRTAYVREHMHMGRLSDVKVRLKPL